MFGCFLQANAQSNRLSGSTDVIPASDFVKLEMPGDFGVYHTNGKYTIEYVVDRKDGSSTHKAIIGSEKSFEKAIYRWISNKKVAVRLMSSDSEDFIDCIVFTDKKNSSGMEMVIDDNGEMEPIFRRP